VSASKGTKVTAESLDDGTTEAIEIKDDYNVVTDGDLLRVARAGLHEVRHARHHRQERRGCAVIRIEVVTTGGTGFIIAVETTDSAPGTGHDWDASGTALVVGQLYRSNQDGNPERWTGWLWPKAGQYPPRGKHTNALSVPGTPSEMTRKLAKQHQAKGAWWQ